MPGIWWVLIGLAGFVVGGPIGGLLVVGGEIAVWIVLRLAQSCEDTRAMQAGIALALAQAQIAKLQAETAALKREEQAEWDAAEAARIRAWTPAYPGDVFRPGRRPGTRL